MEIEDYEDNIKFKKGIADQEENLVAMVLDDKEDNNEMSKTISDFAADDIKDKDYTEREYNLEAIEEHTIEVKRIEETKERGNKLEEYKEGGSNIGELKVDESAMEESKAQVHETETNEVKESKSKENKMKGSTVQRNKAKGSNKEEDNIKEHKTEENNIRESKAEESGMKEYEVEESNLEEIKTKISNEAEAKKEALLRLFDKPKDIINDKPERQKIPIERIINQKLIQQESDRIPVLPNALLIPEVTKINIEKTSKENKRLKHELLEDNSKVSNEEYIKLLDHRSKDTGNIMILSKRSMSLNEESSIAANSNITIKLEEDLESNQSKEIVEGEGEIPVVIDHSREDSSNLV